MIVNKKDIKLYFPIHLDSGNRGCEAISRGCKEVLNLEKEQYVGLCKDIDIDKAVGLEDEVTCLFAKSYNGFYLCKKLFYKILSKLLPTKKLKKQFLYHISYDYFLKKIDTICILTGGDMFCYENNQLIYINNHLHKLGIPTVLFGCSIGEENLTQEKIDTLKKFSAITTRETLTENLLKDMGIDHVYCFPDPAFVLKPKETCLPLIFNWKAML